MLQERAVRDATCGHSGGVNGVLVTPDGKVAVTFSKDTTARLWSLSSGECLHVLQGACT